VFLCLPLFEHGLYVPGQQCFDHLNGGRLRELLKQIFQIGEGLTPLARALITREYRFALPVAPTLLSQNIQALRLRKHFPKRNYPQNKQRRKRSSLSVIGRPTCPLRSMFFRLGEARYWTKIHSRSNPVTGNQGERRR
jgi:hypothetical protein